MIRNLVFDFGGVIIDSSAANAARHFERLGLKDADKYFGNFIQPGIFGSLEAGRLSTDEFCKEFGKLVGHEITFEDAVFGWTGYYIGINLGKLEYLLDMKNLGYRIYLLSNTNPFMMSWADSPAFTQLNKPLSYYFDKMYLSYQCKMVKPFPEFYEYMIKNSGISAIESIFVDDSMVNVIAAGRRGFHTLNPENGEDWRPKLTNLIKKVNGDKSK
ncbi:MAG: HAD family phosphatase [Bacteroidales bacterium]|jgi:putative hydrolase of the HAD superfamily|nr:HAD family phosphatase [Bacteroidales bacterium]MCI2122026.1 HAD family phosphatase [Bacteroidales bacterium]MCI2146219.1 HAD family phosphatase [Bacteroidales bacterium]